jgi:hypothetical protein
METPMCPVCGKIMVYNAAGLQRNAKSPTFKCSNQDCKFQLDKKTGNYIISEFITGVWVDEQGKDKNSTTGQNTPQGALQQPRSYDSFPKKEVKTVMDYKQRQIGESQSNKNEGIRLSGSCRDATMIVTTFYKDCTFSDEQIKEKILFWRSWFYKDVR